MLPFMVLFFLFNILPVLSSMALSLFDYDMVSSPLFIGAENYIRMFTGDDVFLKIVGNTLRFSIVAGPLSYLLAFMLAWMINAGPVLLIVLLQSEIRRILEELGNNSVFDSSTALVQAGNAELIIDEMILALEHMARR